MTPKAIVIGASAGAIQALSVLLPPLPADYAIPVLVVVHIPAAGESLLTGLFQTRCLARVKEAEDKEPMASGVIYFAPSDYHLLVERDLTLALSDDEPVLHSRPSINVLFESAAEALGAEVVGIVLTGANEDGALGLAQIVEAGGVGLVEEPSSAMAPAMPSAALARCPQARAMPLTALSTYLLELDR